MIGSSFSLETISLAFLAPDLIKAAIEGRLPHGMGVVRFTWSDWADPLARSASAPPGRVERAA
jgi:hypothetical protein